MGSKSPVAHTYNFLPQTKSAASCGHVFKKTVRTSQLSRVNRSVMVLTPPLEPSIP